MSNNFLTLVDIFELIVCLNGMKTRKMMRKRKVAATKVVVMKVVVNIADEQVETKVGYVFSVVVM